MIQERTEKFSKEVDDVMLLLVDFISKLKAGVPVTTALMSEIQNAISAVDGVVNVPVEAKEDLGVFIRTIMARAGELAGVLLAKPIVPV